MNFHCYGNIWIHPFNYMHKKHKYPKNAYANIIKFYEDFKGEVAQVSKSKYGNAIETVNYSTDGEGSDWMLGEHKIVAFSPELGSFNPLAQTFFLPKDLIYEVIEDRRYYHIVTDLCTGGELLDRILMSDGLSESKAAFYFYQVISAVMYCHNHDILHRDIKPANILLSADAEPMLADFNLAFADVLDEEEMQQIYNWVDEIPLSRPKRNIARDFSDGGKYFSFF